MGACRSPRTAPPWTTLRPRSLLPAIRRTLPRPLEPLRPHLPPHPAPHASPCARNPANGARVAVVAGCGQVASPTVRCTATGDGVRRQMGAGPAPPAAAAAEAMTDAGALLWPPSPEPPPLPKGARPRSRDLRCARVPSAAPPRQRPRPVPTSRPPLPQPPPRRGCCHAPLAPAAEWRGARGVVAAFGSAACRWRCRRLRAVPAVTAAQRRTRRRRGNLGAAGAAAVVAACGFGRRRCGLMRAWGGRRTWSSSPCAPCSPAN